MKITILTSFVLLSLTVSLAASAEPAKKRQLRRVEQAELRAKTQGKTVQIPVTVYGREMRPLVVTEVQKANLRFGVGTSEYGWDRRSLDRR
jgi:hypothetical protein